MKKANYTLKFFVLLLTLMTIQSAVASTRYQVKCHIELIGGEDAIYFASIPTNDLKELSQSLVGSTVALAGFPKKREVFKVTECTRLDSSFTGGRAQYVDRKTAR